MNVRSSRFLGTLIIAAGLLAAACTIPPQPPAPNPAGLRATLTDAGIELSWNPTNAGQTNGYDLQVLPDGGSWTPLTPGTDASFTFTDVTPREKYGFRVRSSVPSGAPNSWSPSVWTWYVQPTLPILRIETDGRQPVLDRDNYVDAEMNIDPNGSSFEAYSGTLRIRGRGNSTWGYPKKPYKLKLDDKSELLDMPTEKDWVLLANWADRSQMRSWAAGEISRATDLDWTPTYRHVEVILNGEYQGVYNLTEQVEVKSNRVDIEEMEPEDIAGTEVTGGPPCPQLEAVAATIEPAIPNDEARWNYTRGPEDQADYLSDWLQTRIDSMSAAFDAER